MNGIIYHHTLYDPAYTQCVMALLEVEEASVKQLAEIVGGGEACASFHLATLVDCGLVERDWHLVGDVNGGKAIAKGVRFYHLVPAVRETINELLHTKFLLLRKNAPGPDGRYSFTRIMKRFLRLFS